MDKFDRYLIVGFMIEKIVFKQQNLVLVLLQLTIRAVPYQYHIFISTNEIALLSYATGVTQFTNLI